jgi:integrase
MKGTVRRRESGHWQWQYTLGVGSARRHYSRGGYRTRSEAQAALSQELARLGRGEGPTLSRRTPTVADFVEEEWLPVLGSLKPTTRASYAWIVRQLVLPEIGALRLSDVGPGRLAAFYERLSQQGGRGGKGLADSTVHKTAVVVSSLFKHAVEMGLLSTSPVARIPSRQRPRSASSRPDVQAWTLAEARSFLAVTADDRLAIAWHLFLGTGMRRGEVAGLRWGDVDLDRSAIEVRRNRVSISWEVAEGTTKSGKGRKVTIDSGLAAALRRYRRQQIENQLAAGSAWEGSLHDLVLCDEIGRPVHPETLTKSFNAAVASSGLPRIRLHDLRHTHATLLLADGVAAKVVQERLGHSSISVTLDLYGHVTAELEQEAALRMGRLLGG